MKDILKFKHFNFISRV